jgi:TIR domain
MVPAYIRKEMLCAAIPIPWPGNPVGSPGVTRSRESLWLWAGATFVGIGAAISSAAAALYGTRPDYPFWSSWPMICAYAAAVCGFACFAGAAREVPFPLATGQARERRPPSGSGARARGERMAAPDEQDEPEEHAKEDRGEGQSGKLAGHAFISYVREDSSRVDQLQRTLEAAGIRVWRDIAELWPGQDWRQEIRHAITDNALVFIACFSNNSLARIKTYQNDELNLAVDQMRLRRPGVPWLIPVRFDDCEIPDYDIGGGRTLAALERADVFGDRRDEALSRLVTAVLRILEASGPMPESAASPESELPYRHDSATASPGSTTGGQTARESGTGRAAADRAANAEGDPPPWSSGPAGNTVARDRRRRAVPVRRRWIVVIGVLLIASVVAAVGTYLSGPANDNGFVLTGAAACKSGRSVVGVWIAASSGQKDSGFAHLGPAVSGVNYPAGSKVTFSYLLPQGGTYSVHVGCGGIASRWASANYSPVLSGRVVTLECDDPTASPPGGGEPKGECLLSPSGSPAGSRATVSGSPSASSSADGSPSGQPPGSPAATGTELESSYTLPLQVTDAVAIPLGPEKPTPEQVESGWSGNLTDGRDLGYYPDYESQLKAAPGEQIIQLPDGTTPTYTACTSSYNFQPYLTAKKNAAFCIEENSGRLAGVFMKYYSLHSVTLAVTVWKSFPEP